MHFDLTFKNEANLFSKLIFTFLEKNVFFPKIGITVNCVIIAQKMAFLPSNTHIFFLINCCLALFNFVCDKVRVQIVILNSVIIFILKS